MHEEKNHSWIGSGERSGRNGSLSAFTPVQEKASDKKLSFAKDADCFYSFRSHLRPSTFSLATHRVTKTLYSYSTEITKFPKSLLRKRHIAEPETKRTFAYFYFLLNLTIARAFLAHANRFRLLFLKRHIVPLSSKYTIDALQKERWRGDRLLDVPCLPAGR